MTSPPSPAPDFETLLEGVLPSALKTALFLCRSRDDAEDLVQDAALQAFRQFEKFEQGTNFKAWFLKVQHNCFLGRLRSESRRPQPVSVESEEEVEILYLYEQTQRAGKTSFGKDPARSFLGQLDGAAIADALRALPDEFRAVCTLFFIHEMSYEQIAGVTETPLGTVRSRLHRGRYHLQKALWELAQERGLVPGAGPGPSGAPGKSIGVGARCLLLLFSFHAPTFAPKLPGERGWEHNVANARWNWKPHVSDSPFRP